MKRKLGRSGLWTSALGFGCWAIGGPWTINGKQAGWGDVDDGESIRALQRAVDEGVALFDTAANYGCGHSETVVGLALKGRRDGVILATKFGYRVDPGKMNVDFYGGAQDSPEVLKHVKSDCEASLKRLGTDRIDLFQFHIGAYTLDKAAEVRDILEELVAEGKIRFYGWSTDTTAGAAVFAQGRHCTSVQNQLNVFYDAPDMLELCEKENLASINRGPLARGLLSGKYGMDVRFAENDMRNNPGFKETWTQRIVPGLEKIRLILTSGGRTPAQGALAWIWARSGRTIPIPGMRTESQVRENAAAMKFGPLTEEQMVEIRGLIGGT